MSVGLLILDIHSFKLWYPSRSSLFCLNLKFDKLILMYKCNVSKLETVLFLKFCKQSVRRIFFLTLQCIAAMATSTHHHTM